MIIRLTTLLLSLFLTVSCSIEEINSVIFYDSQKGEIELTPELIIMFLLCSPHTKITSYDDADLHNGMIQRKIHLTTSYPCEDKTVSEKDVIQYFMKCYQGQTYDPDADDCRKIGSVDDFYGAKKLEYDQAEEACSNETFGEKAWGLPGTPYQSTRYDQDHVPDIACMLHIAQYNTTIPPSPDNLIWTKYRTGNSNGFRRPESYAMYINEDNVPTTSVVQDDTPAFVFCGNQD